MKLLMSKNGGEREESPSLMKNYYKDWESIMSKDGEKREEVFQQKRIIRNSRRRVELSIYWMLDKNVMRPT